jgi:Holliday junction resolvase-like predicted endonuclease
MSERGVIRNVERKQQINDFSKLIIGKITPTDIDGVIEYKNKAYVFIEVKYNEAELPDGQRIALERMSKDLDKSGKQTMILVAQHSVADTSVSVDVAKCQVRKYYYKSNWRPPKNPITVIEAINIFKEIVEPLPKSEGVFKFRKEAVKCQHQQSQYQ